MSKTYVTSPLGAGLVVPKLHKVVYGRRDRNMGGPLVYEHEDTLKIRNWCDRHCKAPFYTSPGWMEEMFVQFEDDEDATLFALSIPFSQ